MANHIHITHNLQQIADTGATWYKATNDANPQIRIGSADANEVHLQTVYDTGAQTLNYFEISTDSGSSKGHIVLSPASGYVGIGTNNPLTKLNVVTTATTSPRGILSSQYSTGTDGARVGLSKARGTEASPLTVVTGDTLGRLMFRGYDGSNFLEMASIEAIAVGTIGTNRVPTSLAISTATDAAPSVLTERIRINYAGDIGIGTINPAYKLDVNGDINIASTNHYRYNTVSAIYAQTSLTNWMFGNSGNASISGTYGLSAGSDAAHSVTSGGNWVALGQSSGYHNTTGSNWTAVGQDAGHTNVDGSQWTAVGQGAGYTNSSGGNWTALGQAAGQLSTTGSNWTAVGQAAGYANTTGGGWVAVGFRAGRYISGGVNPNETGSTFVCLGSETKVLADGGSNEIVIGYDATGLGSNSVVLGNTSIATTALRGNVGIGTTGPSALLDLQKAGTATALTDIFEITNSGNAASMTDTRTGILFNQFYYDASTPAVADAARITVGTEGNWDSTAANQDAYMSLSVAVNGTVTEMMRIPSTGVIAMPYGVSIVAANIATDTTTGMKIGTATDQKLGFFNKTPVVQLAKASYNNWAALGDVVNALVAIGLFDAA